MKRIILITAMALIPMLVNAGWLRTYELGYLSIGYSGIQTSDGGYIVTGGYVINSIDYANLFLIKTDSTGDTMWTRTYGGEANDQGNCIQQTTDGGYIITGNTNADPDGYGRLWLLKTDSLGDTVWTRVYGGYRSEGKWVEQTSDGGYIITGDYNRAYLWLFKTDEDGYIEWELKMDDGGSEIGYCVQQTSDGGYIVTGFWTRKLLLLKTDTQGDTAWMRLYGNEDYASRGRCVRQTSDGGYVIIGYTGPGNGDIWLLKTDTNGDSSWAHTYGGGQEDDAYEVQQTIDGGYIVVGETRSFGAGNYDVWLLKTDSLGDTLWTRLFGGKRVDRAYRVQQTTDSGYVITGSSGSFSTSLGDALLIKTDSLGYVSVAEPPVQVESNWQVISPIGPHITLRYTNRPQGFHASIFDATGRKVDELHAPLPSGSITWGECYGPGVYFVRESDEGSTARVIIIH